MRLAQLGSESLNRRDGTPHFQAVLQALTLKCPHCLAARGVDLCTWIFRPPLIYLSAPSVVVWMVCDVVVVGWLAGDVGSLAFFCGAGLGVSYLVWCGCSAY